MGLLKDSAKVFTGVTLQRLISFLMLPIIARLIGPHDYGIFQAALSICALFTVFGSLSLDASIPVADSADKAALRTIGTGLIGLMGAILFTVAALLMQPVLAGWFSHKIVHAVIWMVPILVPLTIASNSLRNYAGYLGKFGYFAIADISAAITNFTVIALVYVTLWRDYRALIAGAVAALLAKIMILLWCAEFGRTFKARLKMVTILREMRQTRSFAKYYLPSNALNVYSAELPTIMLAWVFPESVVGVFMMAKSLIMIPTSMCSQALGQVFYPKAAKNFRDGGQLTDITWQSFNYASMFSIFPAFFMAAAGVYIIPTLLGTQWIGTAPYMLLLVPMVILKAVETQIGIGFVFSILNQFKKILRGNLILFVCRFSPFLGCLYLSSSPHIAILSFSLGSALGYAYLTGWIFQTVGISLTRAGKVFMRYCLYSAVCVLPIFLVYSNSNRILPISALLVALVAYTGVVWFLFFNQRQRSDVIKKFGLWNQKESQDTSSG